VQYERTEASGPCEVVGCFLSKWSNKNAIARSAPRERIYRTFSLLLARSRSSSCFFHFLPPSFCRNKRGKKKICHREIETKAALGITIRAAQNSSFLFCAPLAGAALLVSGAVFRSLLL
jgi:hypothetical protein